MPDPTDNQTIVIAVIAMCTFGTLMVFIAARVLSTPIYRLARAMENANSAAAQDLEKVRRDISLEIQREATKHVGDLALELDRHIEVTQGAVGDLDRDVEAAFDNVGRVASVAAEVVETMQVPIAGSTWWGTDGVPLADRTGNRNVVVVKSNVDPNAGYQDTAAHTGALPVQSTPSVGAHHLPEDQAYSPPPFNPALPREVWEYMRNDIRERTGDPNAWPWTLDPAYADSQYTHYDVCRADYKRQYGVELPFNMHELWVRLEQHEFWLQHGPTGNIPPAAQPPTNR